MYLSQVEIDQQWELGVITTDEWVELTEIREERDRNPQLIFDLLDAEATANYNRKVVVMADGRERDGVIVRHTLVGGGGSKWAIQYEVKRSRLGTAWYRTEEITFA